MNKRHLMLLAAVVTVSVLTAGITSRNGLATPTDHPANALAPPESFATIADPAARSAAYFTELGKVLTSPRCTNCHPATDRPGRATPSGRISRRSTVASTAWG